MLSLRMFVGFNLMGLLIYMVIYSISEPEPNKFSDEYYTRQCKYDTEKLCPDCFLEPNCDLFAKNITFKGLVCFNENIDPFDRYLYRRGILNRTTQVVIKNFNPKGTMEMLRNSVCNELNITRENCTLSSNKTFLDELVKRRLTGDPLEGVLFCPAEDERGVRRFVRLFTQPELTTLLYMSTNVHPLIIRLLSYYDKPVPSFIFSQGFLQVESYDGLKLSTYYNDTLKTRLRIAYELISAFIQFDTEVRYFRFYLTNINPDNFVVVKEGKKIVKVLFADLRSVIIHNSFSENYDNFKHYYVHSRVKCDVCFGYQQEEVCSYYYTDINLFAVCQLLMEGHFWKADKGFLHRDEESSEFFTEFDRFVDLLDHCVHCEPPDCAERYKVLKEIQQVINTMLI